jgi:glycosyltransferase involved in cell wall biosynthesis
VHAPPGKLLAEHASGDSHEHPTQCLPLDYAKIPVNQNPASMPATLSVAIVALNEEANLGRVLESVRWADEIVLVDSGSTDRTLEIARSFGAKVFVEAWKGYAAQKNSAIEKATGDYVLSLDADEEVTGELAEELRQILRQPPQVHKLVRIPPSGETTPIFINGFSMPRRNYFLGRWIKHGGFWPDPKLRLFRRGTGRFKATSVHEALTVEEYHDDAITVVSQRLTGALIHHSYPTLTDYLDHMNRYSSLGAEMAAAKGPRGFSIVNILLRPLLTFIYNYFFRLGFLDGREGLLLHLYHEGYVSWKYAKAWEMGRDQKK